MPRVVASIEARMESTRLPGKMLKDVNGLPAISRLLNRLRLCERLDEIVLATSTNSSCDVLARWAQERNVLCYRGSEDDVLERVVEAQRYARSEIVVEINGDCILIDPEIVDLGIYTFLENDCDVVSNCRKPGFPMGFGVQIFTLEALEQVMHTIDDPAVREHVSLYFYEHPELYRLIHLFPPKRWFLQGSRFQLDYEQDLQLINAIYANLEPAYGDRFGLAEIVHLITNNPELLSINQDCAEKSVR